MSEQLPLLSIVIVAYGRRDMTQRCLASIERCMGAALLQETELVLVDNASPDDTRALFEAWRERATVVTLGANRNFAGGCNAGAAAARAATLVFLNNDTVVEPGMLEALAGEVRPPDAGAAGLRLLYPDGSLQHAGVAMIRMPSGLPVPHHLFHHQDGQLPAARITYELDVVTAACLAIRRDVFMELGGFDEAYVNGWEDVDLCLRVRLAGRPVVYRGDLWLWHDEGQTRGTVLGGDANATYFYRRWGGLLDSDEALIADVFGARLPVPRAVAPAGGRADAVIYAMLRGTSPGGAEARGLLAACREAGLATAAREPVPEMVLADLPPHEAREIDHALVLPVGDQAVRIDLDAGTAPPGTIVRLAEAPAQVPPAGTRVWAASPALRASLVAGGMPPEHVAWVPSCVPTGRAGPGGSGVLCVLPAHDLVAAEAALAAVASLERRVRLLPTARSIQLTRLVRQYLPDALLLTPGVDELRLREMAGTADVFLSADPADVFERHALVAAGAGAVPAVVAGGPAHAVLGRLAVVVTAGGAQTLNEGLRRAFDVPEVSRSERAECVHAWCSPAMSGQRIGALFGDHGGCGFSGPQTLQAANPL